MSDLTRRKDPLVIPYPHNRDEDSPRYDGTGVQDQYAKNTKRSDDVRSVLLVDVVPGLKRWPGG